MGDYRLIALDMDGTLLSKGGVVSERTANAIHAALESGIKVVLATGRRVSDVVPISEKLQLNMPLVINNGSEVWQSPDQLHSRHLIDPRLIERLCDYVLKLDERINFWAHTVEGVLRRDSFPSSYDGNRWLQFAFQSPNLDLISEIWREVETWNELEISNSNIDNIEFNPSGISKASGLREVCGMLGIDMSEVIAAGDSFNDISMIRAAGLGVAMGNAQQAVKDAADFIAPRNNEDGVAHVIERFLL